MYRESLAILINVCLVQVYSRFSCWWGSTFRYNCSINGAPLINSFFRFPSFHKFMCHVDFAQRYKQSCPLAEKRNNDNK